VAFTDDQRNAIMTYMGYPATAQDSRYASYYPIWAQIDLLGQSPVTQTPIEALLAELVTVDAAIAASSVTAARGALKKVDEVEFFGPKESMITVVDSLRRGRMLVRRLAQRLGGAHLIADDYFSTGIGSASIDVAMG
jgi:hypothetical protein